MPINESLHRRERAIRAAQDATAEREQQLEDLTLANETLREENERLREALVHIDQIAAMMDRPRGLLEAPQDPSGQIQRIVQDAIWTPTTNAADPETF